MSISSETLNDMLPLYYKRCFPYEDYIQWISYSDELKKQPKYLGNREFSFTLEDDVYVRYQSFDSQAEFEKEVKSRRPHKIDIGAVYTMKPRDHRMRAQFQPVEKELVFDIDMTDYDEVRTCCTGAAICNLCWKFMAIACKILDVALEKDFGWKHKLWVFSGRRGIHCWVCDESARKLDVSQRSAAAEYLQLLTGGEKQMKKVQLYGDILHPSITRALNIIEKGFEQMMLVEQDVLKTKEGCAKFLRMIQDDELRGKVEDEIQKVKTSVERWHAFIEVANLFNKQMGRRKTKYIIEEIMLQYTYPRLDINVSKGLNHLLKSPFCVHPKTGKICVPFSPKNVDSFDTSTVPTIQLLLEEIAAYDETQKNKEMESKNVKDYKKTSLNKSLRIFSAFSKPMLAELKKKEGAESGELKVDF